MDIDRDELYSFAQAAGWLPSPHGGTLSPKTLHDWRRRGLIAFETRQLGKRPSYFLRGEEILRLMQTEKVKATAPRPSGPSQRERELAADRARIAAFQVNPRK